MGRKAKKKRSSQPLPPPIPTPEKLKQQPLPLKSEAEIQAEQEADRLMIELVERNALTWASENGMKGDVVMTKPAKEYFGWTVTLQDDSGRVASARFDKDGNPKMWEMYR